MRKLPGAGRAFIPSKNVVILRIQRNIILFYIGEEFIRSQHLGDLNQLVIVIMAMEEGLLPENLHQQVRTVISILGSSRPTIDANMHP
jgi:hypothetical protein